MIETLLIYLVVIPFAGALIAGLLPSLLSRIIAVIAALAVAVLAIWSVAIGFGAPYVWEFGSLPWMQSVLSKPVFGLSLDPLSSIVLLVVSIIGFCTVFYSTAYMSENNRDHAVGPEHDSRYYFWLLLFVGSMVGIAVSPNFFQLFIFWEMTTMCSWGLISFYQNEKSLKAGFKAMIMTHIGGLFFMFAVIYLFIKTGSTDFDVLSKLSGQDRFVVFAAFIIAAWAKSAQVPINTWLPDAMEAPTPISAYLHAAAMVKAGVYLMARSVSAGWAIPESLGYVLGVAALITMFVALSFYFVQDDLKRLLAYSTIAHLGYVLLGVALGALHSTQGFRGGVLHIICHGFSKATLFFCAGAVAYITGSRSISALQGLAKSMPLTATAFFIGVLSVTGIPPFACFWSKFMILQGAMSLPGALGPIVLIVLLGETLIAFTWMLYIAQRIFFGVASPLAQVNSDPPFAMSATLVILILGCVFAPLVGIPLVMLIGG
jgi:hydrogenase-4 component D